MTWSWPRCSTSSWATWSRPGFVPRGSLTVPDTAPHGSVGRLLVPDLGDGVAAFADCGSDIALLREARVAGLAVDTLSALLEAAEADERGVAATLLSRRAVQVAYVVDVLTDLFQPDRVVLGGGAAPSRRWLEAVRDRLESGIPPTAVEMPDGAKGSLLSAASALVISGFLAAGGLDGTGPDASP